jgi:hypothetical protein
MRTFITRIQHLLHPVRPSRELLRAGRDQRLPQPQFMTIVNGGLPVHHH